MLTFVDLFCGMGGASMGLMCAGLDPVAGVDAAADACASYVANVGRAAHTADVRETDMSVYRGVDVVFGGPPCQGYSTRNMRRTQADPRNDLVVAYLDAIRVIRPAAVALEEVPPAIRSGQFLALVAGLLDVGYWVDYAIVDAHGAGVPQHRCRLVLVAARGRMVRVPALTGLGCTALDAIRDLVDVQPARWPARPVVPHHVVPDTSPRVDAQIAEWCSSGERRCYYARIPVDAPSHAITRAGNYTHIHPTLPRPISVREAMRLQAIPDAAVCVGGLRSQYQQVANAVPPPLAAALGRAIIDAL